MLGAIESENEQEQRKSKEKEEPGLLARQSPFSGLLGLKKQWPCQISTDFQISTGIPGNPATTKVLGYLFM